MPEELDAVGSGLVFVSHAIRRRDVDAIRDCVRALRRPPRLYLRIAELCLLGRMPANRRRIKNDVGAEQAGDARGFRVPLIPADEHAYVRVARLPDAESALALVIAIVRDVRVAGGEVKLLVE